MGWHGFFNWLRNSGSGTIRKPKRWQLICVLERLNNWLPKLSHPVRIGEHDQTAFALGLMVDYAHGNRDQDFGALVVSKARLFCLSDKNCPLAYEPSSEDFLSPCLGEAVLNAIPCPSRTPIPA
jgi:Protein of unknown function (DUF2891)